MSTTIDLTTVTNSIEALTISDVTVLDVDKIVESMQMNPKTLAPRPEDFVTDMMVTRDEVSGQKLQISYVLHYRYYHCPIAGGLGGIFASYSAMMTNIIAIQLKLSDDAKLSGSMDTMEPQPFNIGPVQDPAGNTFLGCEFQISVMQFLEV